MGSIPTDVKRVLVELMEKLPADKQAKFATAIKNRLENLESKHIVKYTLIGGAFGWLLEEIPIIGPSFGTELGLALGAWIGWGKDQEEREDRQRLAKVIEEAYNEAMG